MKKMIIEGKEKGRINFYNKCNIIVLEIPNIPIFMIGLKESEIFNKKFKEVLSYVKKTNSSKIKKIYHFDDTLNRSTKSIGILPSMSIDKYINSFFSHYNKYFDKMKSDFFRYIIIEFSTEKNNERKEIVELLTEHMYILFQVFKIRMSVFNDYTHKDYIDFHAISQSIYSSYSINKRKQSYKKNDFPIDEKIEDVEEKLLIRNFIEYVNNVISQIYNNPLFHVSKFFLQTEVEYKNLREEYIAIKSYILHNKINQDNIIFLGKETKPWDAKINFKNESLIIEVTQAIHRNEHLTRQALATEMYGYKGFSLKLRTIHQEGMDSFPQPIIDAIEKKHKKQYPESRVLLVVVLAEFAYENEFVLNEWLLKIKKETTLGNFKEIWLVVDAEKLYRIH